MKNRWVWVEVSEDGARVVRIFKSEKTAFDRGQNIDWMTYEQAVGDIRHQTFMRSNGFCELCASVVTEKSGHLHEMKHRGKGGEISLDNSVFICARTHKHEHRDRNPHWTKKDLTLE